jgi:hypothetical protein
VTVDATARRRAGVGVATKAPLPRRIAAVARRLAVLVNVVDASLERYLEHLAQELCPDPARRPALSPTTQLQPGD